MPAVSIIIPFYNRSATLARAIKSVLRQTFDDFELICVDDGSTDESAKVVYSFPDPRITLVQHPHNQGAAAARNTGVNHARGEIIAFLDSDDEWHASKLQLQVAALHEKSYEICFSDYTLARGDVHRDFHLQVPHDQKAWGRYFLTGCYVSPGATLMMLRSTWQALNGLDVELQRLEDWDFLLRAAIDGHRFCHVRQPLAIVHLGKGWPKPDTIAKASQRIIRKNKAAVLKRFGSSGLRTLKASAILEHAAAHIRNGNYLMGSIHMLALLLYSPARFWMWVSNRF